MDKLKDGNWLIEICNVDRKYILNNTSGDITQVEEIDVANISIDEEPGILENIGDNMYQINSIEDLVTLSYNVNSGNNLYNDAIIYLGRDLDFLDNNSYENYQSKYIKDEEYGYIPSTSDKGTTIKELVIQNFIGIGLNDNLFQGKEFNGQNYTIENIEIESANAGVGFFNKINRKISINNLKISGKYTSNNQGSIGAIIGYSTAEIEVNNCMTCVECKGVEGNEIVAGGIIGKIKNETIIKNTYSGSLVNNVEKYDGKSPSSGSTVNKREYVSIYGGLIGQSEYGVYGTYEIRIENCVNESVLAASEYSGGAIGYAVNNIININKFRNIGDSVENYISENTGGVIGGLSSSAKGTIENVENRKYMEGDVGEIEALNYAGGIIGFLLPSGSTNTLKISNCNNYMFIGDDSTNNSGGIIGCWSVGGNLSVENVHNYGWIYSKSVSGGCIGSNGSNNINILNFQNSGEIISKETGGGCIGKSSGNIKILNAENRGKIQASLVGGIVGDSSCNKLGVYNSYNVAEIGLENGNIASGILASISSTANCKITNCYNQGKINTSNSTAEIILSTFTNASIKNCYYRKNINPNISTTNALQADNNNPYDLRDKLNNNIKESTWKKWKIISSPGIYGWETAFED